MQDRVRQHRVGQESVGQGSGVAGGPSSGSDVAADDIRSSATEQQPENTAPGAPTAERSAPHTPGDGADDGADDRAGAVTDTTERAGPPAGATGSEAAGGEAAGGDVAELERVRRELAERTADLQRVSAEYANFRRRVERDREGAVAAAKAQVAGELLTVLDDLERAAAHGDLTGPFKVVADGLVGALHRVGLTAFGVEGDAFDPSVHEAVAHRSSSEVTGPTVTAVMRRGYRFGERVLRPAMVEVTDVDFDSDSERGSGPDRDPGPDHHLGPEPGPNTDRGDRGGNPGGKARPQEA